MGTLEITCLSCSKKWQVYSHGNFRADECRICPRCGAEITKAAWERSILPAFGSMEDANRDLKNEHTGMKHPLFQIDYTWQ